MFVLVNREPESVTYYTLCIELKPMIWIILNAYSHVGTMIYVINIFHIILVCTFVIELFCVEISLPEENLKVSGCTGQPI